MKQPPKTPQRPKVAPMSDADFALAENLYGKDPDVIKAQEGIEMRSFWNSKAGQILEIKTIELKDEGVAKMLDLDPEDDMKAWRKAKLDVLVAERILVWIAEVLQEGEMAIDNLTEQADKLQDYRSTH